MVFCVFLSNRPPLSRNPTVDPVVDVELEAPEAVLIPYDLIRSSFANILEKSKLDDGKLIWTEEVDFPANWEVPLGLGLKPPTLTGLDFLQQVTWQLNDPTIMFGEHSDKIKFTHSRNTNSNGVHCVSRQIDSDSQENAERVLMSRIRAKEVVLEAGEKAIVITVKIYGDGTDVGHHSALSINNTGE
jgi:hypothetical protein